MRPAAPGAWRAAPCRGDVRLPGDRAGHAATEGRGWRESDAAGAHYCGAWRCDFWRPHNWPASAPPWRTRRGRRGRAAARPPDPATEPHESGVAHGELVHEATDRAAPCKPAPGAPPSSAALAAVTPPPAEEPPPPTATGVHGARDERGVSSEDEATSGPLRQRHGQRRTRGADDPGGVGLGEWWL